jgi:2-polyprenyl-6-methoxyphenol hydroxylase-like FAD-dependent oxidoreductase
MTLARTLASFGVRCLLVERQPSTTRHPKMDITNGRSMELFRRIGLADKLRAVAWPRTPDARRHRQPDASTSMSSRARVPRSETALASA